MFLHLLVVALASIVLCEIKYSSVDIGKDGMFEYNESDSPMGPRRWCARAQSIDNTFQDSQGWIQLDIVGSLNCNDTDQMYSVGFLEANLLQEQIWNHYHNFYKMFEMYFYPICSESLSWLEQNRAWTEQLIASHADRPRLKEGYYHQIHLTLQHFHGIVDGYQSAAPIDQQLSVAELWLYMSFADLIDIDNAVNPETRPNWADMDPVERHILFSLRNHCTGMVRRVEETGDWFATHNTWLFYSAMTRVIRSITLNLENGLPSAKQTVSMSSYPGFLFSSDSFLVNSNHKLAVIETTLDVFDTSLYDLLTTESLLTWFRAATAVRSSKNADDFIDTMSQNPSGTYNCQWIVVDHKKQDNNIPQEGFLTIMEQMPGQTEYADKTDDILLNGYWPSYNVPSFPDLYNISGYRDIAKIDVTYDYDLCPRAQMFSRDAGTLSGLSDVEWFMRMNEWETDPLSLSDAGNAISARYDLRTDESDRVAQGAIDVKITSNSLWDQDIIARVITGPTTQDQPPFTFADWPEIIHMGLPDGPYDYDWLNWAGLL